jgi:hypothetical protein
MEPNSDNCVVDPRAFHPEQELSIGSRVDTFGHVTHHVVENDKRAGVSVEKIYDEKHRLIRMQKRTPISRSETAYDWRSGAVLRVFESASLSDGNSMTKEVVYGGDDRSNESITVLSPSGELVRKVEREFIGSRTTYQGQTEYANGGLPSTTVNHKMDEATGRLMRREQIQWLHEGQRLLSESFLFDSAGGLQTYTKTLYHQAAGPFIEERQLFDSRTQVLLKREITAFDRTGKQTRNDVLTYSDSGEIEVHDSHFFDKDGRDIAAVNPNR